VRKSYSYYDKHLEPIYLQPIEQQYEHADAFEDIPELSFFIKTPYERKQFSIAQYERGVFVEKDDPVLVGVRAMLMKRDGIPIASTTPSQNQPPSQSAIAETKESYKVPKTKGKL